MATVAYEFSQDSKIYKDCSFASTVLGSVAAGEILLISEVAGGWYKSDLGWIWGWGTNNNTPIVKKMSTESTNVGIGSYITLDTNTTIRDVNGNLIPISSGTDNFVVKDINTVRGITLISSGGNNYWVDSKYVSVANNGVIVVPSEVAEAQTPEDENQVKSYSTYDLQNVLATQGNNSRVTTFLDELRINDMRGIFGMPYQYSEICDPRITAGDSTSFGATYAEKIVSKLPLLVMVPGSPEFLSGYSKEEKENVVKYALNTFTGGEDSKTDFDSLINNPGKYYGLKVDWKSYFMHVNPMCRAAARMLGLQGYTYLDGGELGSYLWEKNANDKIKGILNYKGGSAFYINSETQISESFGNSSTQSMIAGKINGISDLGREMNFLLGGAAATTGLAVDRYTQDKQIARNQENEKDFVDNMVSGHNLIEGISSGLKTVIAGGKLIFPEIWSDSQFSRDYDVSVKLTSPDCDPYSLYINIIVPILHLVGFAAPRSTGVNGYVSPFLVRAFYKGMFNCDMGIITNMSIQKGNEGSWSPYGIPTSVEVHFTIKELYGTMAISSNANIKQGLLRNLSLMDYIGNLCGININEPDLLRSLYFYYSQNFTNKFQDAVYTNVVDATEQWVTNKLLKFTIG